MKKAWLLLTIFSFLGVAVFGFVIFGNCAEGGMGCVASFVQGLSCPATSGQLTLDFVHAQTFHGFSLALSSSYLVMAALIILLLLLARPIADMFGTFLSSRRDLQENKTLPIHDCLLSWLARHEKRDPSFCL